MRVSLHIIEAVQLTVRFFARIFPYLLDLPRASAQTADAFD